LAATCWTRRKFLRSTAAGVAWATGGARATAGLLSFARQGTSAAPEIGSLEELIASAPTARYWTSTTSATREADCLTCHEAAALPENLEHKHKGNIVRCQLCAQGCLIDDGERGRCRARMNRGGELKTLVYGRPISVHVDPIEKKPFFHFLPGRAAFSMATSGCPLSCKFCQNWEISQARPEDFKPTYLSPDRVVRESTRRRAPIVAFTYNEPTVFTEYLCDIARIARREGRRSALVSCGFMQEAPLAEMCQVLDAIKIDLKGFSEDFYSRVCSAQLAPVLRSIKQVAASGIHLEIVNLVVPTLNDSTSMLTELAKWVVGEVGPEVPVHFTRFHPDYQLRNLPPTPVATLEKAREIALRAGMHYAFVGNVPGHEGNSTHCPKCGEVVIRRHGFLLQEIKIDQGRCAQCRHPIAGVWI